MSKKQAEELRSTSGADDLRLRTYPAPWKSSLILACRKCQKKLKNDSHPSAIANLKKVLKLQTAEDDNPIRLRVLQVPCLKLCPKDGIAVCTQNQLAQNMCSLVRSTADVKALYRLCRKEQDRRAHVMQ